MTAQNTPATPQPSGVFVYDTRNGRVVHVHQHIALPNSTPVSDDEIASNALRYARARAGNESLQLETVLLRPSELAALDTRASYFVDLPTKSLIVKSTPSTNAKKD